MCWAIKGKSWRWCGFQLQLLFGTAGALGGGRGFTDTDAWAQEQEVKDRMALLPLLAQGDVWPWTQTSPRAVRLSLGVCSLVAA